MARPSSSSSSSGGPPRGKGRLDSRHGHQPDAGRRGKDDDVDQPRDGHATPRQERRARAARAVARSRLRREGRRHGRRQGLAHARRGHQPSLHRRHPRHHHRAQPAVGAGRQLRVLRRRHPRQRRDRSAPGHVGPRDGHERSLPAQDASSASAARRAARRAKSASTSPRRARSWPIMALASDYVDLEKRLARIVIGNTYDGKAVTAGDIHAASAMTAVLRDALKPNLVQTDEGGPAIVHCGPFGNIAHGCNSVIATRLAINLGDYAITEGGFGFDLGGEKFLDIKCRLAGIWPRAVVVVATLRALKMHGGAPVKTCGQPDAEKLKKGIEHLEKHLETAQAFGLKPIVAINVFPNDTEGEIEMVETAVAAPRRSSRALRGLRQGRRRRARPRARRRRGRRRHRRRAAARSLHLRGRRRARGQDPQDRAHRVRREGRHLHRPRGEEPSSHSRARLRAAAHLHGEDADVAHRRSRPSSGVPVTSRSPCARCASRPARASSSRSPAT